MFAFSRQERPQIIFYSEFAILRWAIAHCTQDWPPAWIIYNVCHCLASPHLSAQYIQWDLELLLVCCCIFGARSASSSWRHRESRTTPHACSTIKLKAFRLGVGLFQCHAASQTIAAAAACSPARRPLTEISQLPARSNCAQNISPAAAIRLCWPNLRCKLICVTSAKSLILWLVSAPCLQNKTLIAGLMEGFFCVCAGSSQKLKWTLLLIKSVRWKLKVGVDLFLWRVTKSLSENFPRTHLVFWLCALGATKSQMRTTQYSIVSFYGSTRPCRKAEQ